MSNKKPIFVFGSNEAGIHGAGAARVAYKEHGARMQRGFGHYGDSFAIPTKDRNLQTLDTIRIKKYVDAFLIYAEAHPDETFMVTQIGCGLAGLKPEEIAPLFHYSPQNCHFDEAWAPWLGECVNYWGTFS